MLLYELCVGYSLFKKDNDDCIMPAEQLRLCLWADISDQQLAPLRRSIGAPAAGACHLIRWCLAADPAERLAWQGAQYSKQNARTGLGTRLPSWAET